MLKILLGLLVILSTPTLLCLFNYKKTGRSGVTKRGIRNILFISFIYIITNISHNLNNINFTEITSKIESSMSTERYVLLQLLGVVIAFYILEFLIYNIYINVIKFLRGIGHREVVKEYTGKCIKK